MVVMMPVTAVKTRDHDRHHRRGDRTLDTARPRRAVIQKASENNPITARRPRAAPSALSRRWRR